MEQTDLERFYEATLPMVYRFFFYHVLNREIAEDLTSTTFLTFAREVRKKNVERWQNYIFGIAKHVLLDHLRNKYRRNEKSLDEFEETLAVDDAPATINVLDLLEKILPKLPEKQAVVLRLRFLEKLSLSEIATALNKDVNYVSTTQKRAFQSIRRLVGCTANATNIKG